MATKKQTSADVSKIAAARLAQGSPFNDPELKAAISVALRECGVPINERAIVALCDRIEVAFEPVIVDLRKLAASCLSQDETPPASVVLDPPIVAPEA